jgi:LmbE family N-acetylglucosaminyl deacetylase
MRDMMKVASGADDLPDLGENFGVPGELITTRVDVTPWTDRKRKAMQAHASQIGEQSFFLAMPPDIFKIAFGNEQFILKDAPPGTAETDLFEGLQ